METLKQDRRTVMGVLQSQMKEYQEEMDKKVDDIKEKIKKDGEKTLEDINSGALPLAKKAPPPPFDAIGTNVNIWMGPFWL